MKNAFSLVELSIVLVILGLLTGGILSGQSLIAAAQLRSVASEMAHYQTAVMTFRDGYGALPGDMNNATNFWGAMTNCAAASPSGSGTQTCNGNGDGQINWPTHPGRTGEMFGIWKQLANAGLIEGSYSGIAGTGTYSTDSIIGTNVPKSRFSNGGWSVLWRGVRDSADTTYFAGDYGNLLLLGAQIAGDWTAGFLLTPEELWNIDSKADDGKPETGKIRALEAYSGMAGNICSNSTTQEYALQNTAKRCQLILLQAF